jgi:hypothetical protein
VDSSRRHRSLEKKKSRYSYYKSVFLNSNEFDHHRQKPEKKRKSRENGNRLKLVHDGAVL